MSEQNKGTVRGNGIELERAPSLPEGSRVLLTIEAIATSDEERRQAIPDLCGAWTNDQSLSMIFTAIADARHRAGKSRLWPCTADCHQEQGLY